MSSIGIVVAVALAIMVCVVLGAVAYVRCRDKQTAEYRRNYAHATPAELPVFSAAGLPATDPRSPHYRDIINTTAIGGKFGHDSLVPANGVQAASAGGSPVINPAVYSVISHGNGADDDHGTLASRTSQASGPGSGHAGLSQNRLAYDMPLDVGDADLDGRPAYTAAVDSIGSNDDRGSSSYVVPLPDGGASESEGTYDMPLAFAAVGATVATGGNTTAVRRVYPSSPVLKAGPGSADRPDERPAPSSRSAYGFANAVGGGDASLGVGAATATTAAAQVGGGRDVHNTAYLSLSTQQHAGRSRAIYATIDDGDAGDTTVACRPDVVGSGAVQSGSSGREVRSVYASDVTIA